jgi:hypothetical protein
VKSSIIRALGALSLSLLATPLFAQATRTWVSGVGDDVNPCSRTAPCKTFAGAISKTAANGEINVLDPGGFGAVTITKSITIDGGGGPHASILAGGTQGVAITGAAGTVVTLRNLSINGSGGTGTPGTNGVRVNTAGAVRIENVSIFGFSGRGVDIQSSTPVEVAIINSTIHDNGGIGVALSAAVGSRLDVIDSRVISNGSHGVWATGGGVASIFRSTLSENTLAGVVLNGTNTRVTVADSLLSRNKWGVQAGTGVGSASGAIIGLTGNTITGNFTAGVSVEGAAVETHGTNAIRRNATDISGGVLTSVGVQ